MTRADHNQGKGFFDGHAATRPNPRRFEPVPQSADQFTIARLRRYLAQAEADIQRLLKEFTRR